MQEAFVMLHILEHTLSHTIEDSVKLLPFLFFTYLLMELLEHTTGGKVQNKIKNAGKVGPLWGGLLGIMPQCGFSAAAASLYACLLYTSPSPRDGLLSRMPSSA